MAARCSCSTENVARPISQKYSELLGALSLVDWKKSGTGKFKLFFSMGLTFVCFKNRGVTFAEKNN